jgi:hypothetical protein
MTQYLVAIHHADDYDPSVAKDDAMSRDIDAIHDEVKAAGVRVFVGRLHPQAARRRCGPSPTVRCLPAAGRTLRPRNTWGLVGAGSRGPGHGACLRARGLSPVGRRSRYALFTDRGSNGMSLLVGMAQTLSSGRSTKTRPRECPARVVD